MTETNLEIAVAFEKYHKQIWEEMRAPCGHHLKRAETKRKEAEKNLRRKLATLNPRDVKAYRKTANGG